MRPARPWSAGLVAIPRYLRRLAQDVNVQLAFHIRSRFKQAPQSQVVENLANASRYGGSGGLNAKDPGPSARTIIDRVQSASYGSVMKKASEYRAHARECRALAAQMDSPAQRDQMLAMATHWDQLARDRAELIRKHPDLAIEGEQDEERGPAAAEPSAPPA